MLTCMHVRNLDFTIVDRATYFVPNTVLPLGFITSDGIVLSTGKKIASPFLSKKTVTTPQIDKLRFQ